MSRKQVLIVDDDPDVRQAMHIRLKANGFDTVFAGDAGSCIEVACKETPDLILLDLGLPGGDGFVVMERIKEYPALSGVPIIVVSARDPRANRERALAAGAYVYLQKPVDDTELIAIIHGLIDHHTNR